MNICYMCRCQTINTSLCPSCMNQSEIPDTPELRYALLKYTKALMTEYSLVHFYGGEVIRRAIDPNDLVNTFFKRQENKK